MPGKVRATLSRLLAARAAPLWAILLGLLLLSPSLPSGLAADDWFHRLVLTGNDTLAGVHHRSMDLFVFSNGDPVVGHAQQESGLLGWWADPSTALAYFRPLASLTHLLDYRLFPDAPLWMHVHSLLWFFAGLVALRFVYARFAEVPLVATLALLLYSVDDAHGFVVSWIANRNALLALALGAPVLVLHDRFRRGGEGKAAVLAPVLFFASLFAGESAAAIGGYLLAYAVFMEDGRVVRRGMTIVPYGIAFLAWRALYAALGYGTHGSGLAVDPVHDPLGYAQAVAVRLPVLLLGQLALPPSDVWEIFPVLGKFIQPAVYAVAIVVPVLLAVLLWPILKSERSARFWALGMVLAALPPCSQVPHDRLLLFVGIGAQALVARLLVAVLGSEAWTTRNGRTRLPVALGAGFAVVVHGVLAPLWLPFRARGPADVTRMLSTADRTIPSDPSAREKTVVLVNPPADAFAGYLPMMRAGTGRVIPRHLRWIATGASAATITRTGPADLHVSLADGFMSLASERMQRSAEHPMPVGYTVSLAGMTVVVKEVTADARPKAIDAHFEKPLEDPSLVFLEWEPDGYVPFPIPPVGSTVTLPAVDFTKLKM